MFLMIVVGVAFLLFCIVAVAVITMLAQPPNKAVDYYVQNRVGAPKTKRTVDTGLDSEPRDPPASTSPSA